MDKDIRQALRSRMVRRQANSTDPAVKREADALINALDSGEPVGLDDWRLGSAMNEAGYSAGETHPVKHGPHGRYVLFADNTFRPLDD